MFFALGGTKRNTVCCITKKVRFPEHTLTKIKELNGAHYLLVVERTGLLDSLEIKVELNPAYFTDTIKNIEKLKKIVEHEVTSAIGIAPKITFCSPGEIPLSDGKTKRTIDNRKI